MGEYDAFKQGCGVRMNLTYHHVGIKPQVDWIPLPEKMQTDEGNITKQERDSGGREGKLILVVFNHLPHGHEP